MNLKESLHRKLLHIQVSEILRKEIIPRFAPGETIDAESKLARQLGIIVHRLGRPIEVANPVESVRPATPPRIGSMEA